ncbi:putative protein phosphatase 2C-like protein 44 isoform X1 [Rosa rugosa]|uniref:putative protein phosphatase 2C-like protein 44 isoform X1 n=3 Tax=Rosa rugosa TaxID=74645 RepID=UPI002B413049|nr:putative protein phosphatase 2C-like protein 44 isoform X1 [Rosa rugosa]
MADNHNISGKFMGLKDFHLKFKQGFQLRRILKIKTGVKKKEANFTTKPSWMMPAVSHGHHVVEGYDEFDCDYVVAQREQIEELEVWLFGVSDPRIGDGITKYMQAHLFDKKPKESIIKGKSNETMRKAYLDAKAKVRDAQGTEETNGVGSVSAMVINGEKLVLANMGDYRAIVCREGLAHEIGIRHKQSPKMSWTHRLFKANNKQSKSSDLVVGAEKIENDIEFVILASSGIWEVMKYQEAVNLIRRVENPEIAAECLASEASNRMSRSNISCLVIRFD